MSLVRKDFKPLVPLWNTVNLEKPKILSLPMKSEHAGIQSRNMSLIFHKILAVLEQQSQLHKEAALISRLKYRMKKKFVKDKGFKAFEKVNKMLCHYLSLDLTSIMTDLSRSCYETNGPSHEMLEWGIINLQAFGCLFKRIRNTCVEAVSYFNMRLRDGHFWDVALLSITVLSRVWSISNDLLQKSSKWYTMLLPYLSEVTSTGTLWLPGNCSLPQDLSVWLGIQDSAGMQNEEKLEINENLKQTKSGNVEQVKKISPDPLLNEGRPIFKEDIGEVVSRKEFVTRKTNLLSDVNSTQKLFQFMKEEKILRKENRDICQTKQLDNLQWKKFESHIFSNLTKLRVIQDSKKFKKMLKQLIKEVIVEFSL